MKRILIHSQGKIEVFPDFMGSNSPDRKDLERQIKLFIEGHSRALIIRCNSEAIGIIITKRDSSLRIVLNLAKSGAAIKAILKEIFKHRLNFRVNTTKRGSESIYFQIPKILDSALQVVKETYPRSYDAGKFTLRMAK
jgi:hypothetical protein